MLLTVLCAWTVAAANTGRQGLDLDKLATKRRFAFLDGLSGLFLGRTKSRMGTGGANTLQSDELENIRSSLKSTVHALQADGGKVVLVIDQLDLLLATSGDKMSIVALGDMLMDLRLVSELADLQGNNG